MRVTSSSLNIQSYHEELQSSTVVRHIDDTHVQTLTQNSESENLMLQATGSIKTQTGAVLDIALHSTLSRKDRYEAFTVQSLGALVDPLVINLEGGLARIDLSKTFLFDLNGDGNQEEIALLGRNNGFLAWDKNENGIIDEGSELFGTKSGDGFADLSAHDEDSNGWIDENDTIFSKLKIWQKSAVQDNLLSLNQAQVGALLLESTDAPFRYKNGATTDALLQKSGVVLFENGTAGWMSHVDFAIKNTQTQASDEQEAKTPVGSSMILQKAQESSSSSDLNKGLLSALKNRLKMLEKKLAKAHDPVEKSDIMVQMLKISMQIAQLGGLSKA